MIHKLVESNNPVLRKKAKPVKKVDKKIKKLVDDMIETLDAQTDPEGVGLAAPQIGKSLQIFIMKYDDVTRAVINPEVIEVAKLTKKELRKKVKVMEGCLSLPHYYGPLHRATKVTIKFLDETGNEHTETFKDFPAQIVLHEVDHLEGVLFVDRLLEQEKPLYEYDDGDWTQVEI